MKDKLELLKQKVKELEQYKRVLADELRLFVVDRSIPLQERWEIFKHSDLGEHSTYTADFVNFESDDWCDAFDRHVTIDLLSVQQNNWYYVFENEDAYNEFREDVLRCFMKSFENDW